MAADAAGFTALPAGAAPEAALLAAAACFLSCFLSCFLACIGLDAAAAGVAGVAAIIGAAAVIAGLAGVAAGVWANDRLAAEANSAAMSRDLVMVVVSGSDKIRRRLRLW